MNQRRVGSESVSRAPILSAIQSVSQPVNHSARSAVSKSVSLSTGRCIRDPLVSIVGAVSDYSTRGVHCINTSSTKELGLADCCTIASTVPDTAAAQNRFQPGVYVQLILSHPTVARAVSSRRSMLALSICVVQSASVNNAVSCVTGQNKQLRGETAL